MRARTFLPACVVCLACGGDPAPSGGDSAAAAAQGPVGVPPERLAAKMQPDACGLLDPATVQSVLGLPIAPTPTAGTESRPARSYCRYAWTDGDATRHVELAWATELQDQPEKVAKGLELAKADLAERRVHPVEVPGAVLATWGEQWLTVYANDRQVLWVIMESAGKNPRDSRELATALATAAVK